MIYTDGTPTIANTREDTGHKVRPHDAYTDAIVENSHDVKGPDGNLLPCLYLIDRIDPRY